MENVIDTFGEIQEGKLLIYDNELLKSRLQNTPDCRIRLLITVRKGTVTQQMRRFYFGPLLKELQKAFFAAGQEYAIDELDYVFRMKALYKEVYDEERGRMIKEPHSLKEADTEVTISMMSFYFEYIVRFAIQKLDWAIAFPKEILDGSDLTDNQVQELLKRK